MRVNRRGGYDVVLKNEDLGAYLGGVDAGSLEAFVPIPEWLKDPFLARAEDDEDDMLEVALKYDLIGDDGFLIPGYHLERIPWLSDEWLDDDRFYDDAGDYDIQSMERFVFGNHDIYDVNPNPYAYRRPGSAFVKRTVGAVRDDAGTEEPGEPEGPSAATTEPSSDTSSDDGIVFGLTEERH